MAENTVERKLRAILSADVKGYSRMMGEDEVGTYQTLTANLESIRSIISEHKGRVFSSPGDAVMAEFSSVVDAVQCGVELQEKIEATNADVPEDRKMQFRIGVNLGDVIHDGEQVYGDGVNIAARIETLAEPGGVLISKTVYNHAHKKLKFGYEFQGEHTVKNIAEPVSVYKVLTAPEHAGQLIGEPKTPKRLSKQSYISFFVVLALVVVAAVWQFFPRAPEIETASVENMAYPLPDKPSIAVLPLDNMSGDPEQEYIADGITESIISALSKIEDMLVIARNSTFTYKGKPVKVQQVSEELGVRYVLEGSTQKIGDRVRITAQLIDATTGHHLWSEKYDREMKDLFALQDEITLAIILAMRVELTEGKQASITGRGTEILEAYLKAMRAQKQFYLMTKEGSMKAKELVKEAIALDPNYAFPYATLANAHMLDVWFKFSASSKESMRLAAEAAQKALTLDASDPKVYHALTNLYIMQRQYEKAIDAAEHRLELSPSGAQAYNSMGLALNFSGKHSEAIPFIEKAIRLDPYPPSATFRTLADAYSNVGRYEEAITEYKKALQQNPDDIFAHLDLADNYMKLGREEEARAEAKEVIRIHPKFSLSHYARSVHEKDRSDLNDYIERLRKAGLPD